MNEAIRYDKGLGNSEVYARVTNGSLIYDFSAGTWGSETSGCRVFMTEYPDSSTVQSWYSVNIPPIPDGGPYGVDIVRVSSGELIGNDFISQYAGVAVPIDVTAARCQDMFDIVLTRLSNIKKPIQMDFFSALNATIDIIFRRLLVRKSEIVHGSFSQAATSATVTLPSDFFGFSERPYLSGSRSLLDPLPLEMKSSLTQPSTPLYYELRGNTMTLFPTPNTNVTVVGQYIKKPTALTTLTDAVPFNGLFDFAIQEAVIIVCQMGVAAIMDGGFNKMLYKQIDEVLSFRAPRQVRFRQVIENGQRRTASPYYF